ncbi:tetratricopeptide repeat protein [Actinomycetes bacterium KLBMP 9797]
MTDARVWLGAPGRPRRYAGAAVLVADRLALTADHVVRTAAPADVALETPTGTATVRGVDRDGSLDVALLHLAEAAPATAPTIRVAAPAAGTQWTVTTRPAPGDPRLTGVVTAVDQVIENSRGTTVTVLQLRVDQTLEDYSGYSGSAVRSGTAPQSVVGVLVEQVRSRLRRGDGQPRPASNVLYAVPATVVFDRFDLTAGISHDAALDRVRAFVAGGALDDADRELAGLPAARRGTPEYWYWRARVAAARGNVAVAVGYADRALAADPRHARTIALKIRVRRPPCR